MPAAAPESAMVQCEHDARRSGPQFTLKKLPDFLRQYEEMMEDARNANRDFEGQLRIGFLDIYDASSLFPPVVEAFQSKQNLYSWSG